MKGVEMARTTQETGEGMMSDAVMTATEAITRENEAVTVMTDINAGETREVGAEVKSDGKKGM